MFVLVGVILFICIWLIAYKFFTDIDFYTKILSFYLMMTNMLVMILFLLFNKMSFAVDLTLLLFMLQLFIVLVLMSSKINKDMYR